MYQKEVTVVNPTGLHARPAAQLTKLCKPFPETIRLVTATKEVDPKNIMGILSAGMKKGTRITVKVEGANEEAVCNEIVDFIQNLKE